ncbi:zinc finger and BTB domain-containing protein 4 [Carettochelys insculpta]|uniref:zinc finger and BTB domain-containing protein 4 n=1 Tax=Carettochelys insculpta TaxID=44489 RepID=UPI003EB9C5BF
MAPVVELSDAGHSRSLLVALNEQRLSGQFCDVTIIAEDTKFPAHKNVLAASSPYFKEVLSSQPPGRQPGQVLELPDIQAGVFSDILNFIYRSRLSVPNPAAARRIGAAGRRLGISWLEHLDSASPAKEMSQAWSPEAGEASSPHACASPVDLTCPSRPAEPASPAGVPEREVESAAEILSALADPPAKEPPASPCGLCGRCFPTPAALGVHLKLHRSRRALSCRHCGKAFIHIKRLQTHEVLCQEAEEEDDDQGAAGAPEAPAEPAPAAPATPKPASSKKGLLLRHRALPRLDYLSEQDHFVKVVDGHLIYFCSVCERSYMTLSSLKRHSNVHSWRRKYPCRYCDKVFALAEYRTKHEVWHTGERRYQCIFCWETFVTYYNLKTHQKAFHGINPGLISSEKTANGGYRPKLNAFKLYRLLPMRSQKRPYKTYSENLLPPPARQGEAGFGEAAEAPEAEESQAPADPAEARSEAAPEGSRRAENGEAPSVIAYGHPSVIVHSTSVQAPSVIAYTSQPAPARPEPLKKQVLKEYIQAQKVAEEAREAGQPRRTMTYMAKPAYVGAASESRAAPLCQITVRIGEEAIVKRHISETDLRLDKSPPRAEAEKPVPGRESGEEESDRDAEDRLWRPYYTYKPKRKGGGAGTAVPKRSARWCRKLRLLRRAKRAEEEPGPPPALKAGAEWKHQCGACGKLFSAVKKLRKHERVHSRAGKDDPSPAPAPRVGRKPSVKFTCSRCAKVCKTAAALSRHAKRHEGEPPTVIAYSKKAEEPAAEEMTQEMQVSSSSGNPPAPEPAREETPPPEASAPPAEAATTSHAKLVPAPPGLSLQDPVISHTGPAPLEERDAYHARYPVQEYPLPLLAPGSCRTHREAEDKPPFLGYPEPYPLMYGPQFVAAYPYNFTSLAALPVAVNMVLPDDQAQCLPFLPGVFGYAVGPCQGEAQEAGASGAAGRGEAPAPEHLKKGSLL